MGSAKLVQHSQPQAEPSTDPERLMKQLPLSTISTPKTSNPNPIRNPPPLDSNTTANPPLSQDYPLYTNSNR